MNRHTIPLGRILGIPIGLDSFLVLDFGLIPGRWPLATTRLNLRTGLGHNIGSWAGQRPSCCCERTAARVGTFVVAMHYKIRFGASRSLYSAYLPKSAPNQPLPWVNSDLHRWACCQFALQSSFSCCSLSSWMLCRYWPWPNIWSILTSC